MPLATQHLADARLRAGAFQQVDQRAVIGAEQLADRRMDAGQPFAFRLDFGSRAAHLIHVGGGAADVADDALELRVGGHLAALRCSTDSCERDWMIRPWWAVIEQNVQPPKQPRIERHRILDHLMGRDRLACTKDAAGACRADRRCDPFPPRVNRQRRRIGDHRLAVVKLHQRLGVEAGWC